MSADSVVVRLIREYGRGADVGTRAALRDALNEALEWAPGEADYYAKHSATARSIAAAIRAGKSKRGE